MSICSASPAAERLRRVQVELLCSVEVLPVHAQQVSLQPPPSSESEAVLTFQLYMSTLNPGLWYCGGPCVRLQREPPPPRPCLVPSRLRCAGSRYAAVTLRDGLMRERDYYLSNFTTTRNVSAEMVWLRLAPPGLRKLQVVWCCI